MLNQEVVGNLSKKFYEESRKLDSKLTHISVDYIGFEWTSPAIAKEYGITISNVPHYSTLSMAEYTLATIFMVLKRLHEFDFLNNKTQPYKSLMNDNLYNKTIGVVGLGKIGERVAKLASGVGMNVIAWNRTDKKIDGVKLVSLEELFQKSDIITVHLITNEHTQALFTHPLFKLAKKKPYMFNHTSETLIDEKLILKALDEKIIKCYVNSRDYIKSKKLLAHENCISVPHQGWFTAESMENLESTWVENTIKASKGIIQNRVN